MDVKDALAGLWQRFAPTIFARIDTLDSAAIALRDGRLTAELREQAKQEAHKLAGSLGTFGFPRGSELARDLEGLFGSPESQTDRAMALVAELRGVLKPPSGS